VNFLGLSQEIGRSSKYWEGEEIQGVSHVIGSLPINEIQLMFSVV
jgi:hypothetical protein